MKRILLCTAAALMIAVTPAAAGGKGGKQGINANLNVATGKGGILGALLGTVRGHNGLNVNANVTTGKGGVLGTILGGR